MVVRERRRLPRAASEERRLTVGRPVVWSHLMCESCGVIFRVKPCMVRRGRRFCSVTCRHLLCPPPSQFGNRHAWKGNDAGRNAMHYRARLLTESIPTCQRCGSRAQLTHHIDENPWNNTPENLERLCRRCHIAHHRAALDRGRSQRVKASKTPADTAVGGA